MSAVTVDFWNVGYGDAAVVHLGRDRVAIIDCGPIASRLPEWLRARGVSIPLLVLTHNDTDHAGGLHSLLSLVGRRVVRWLWVHDRSAPELLKQVEWIRDGVTRQLWRKPEFVVAPQVLLRQREPVPVRVEVIYPDSLELVEGASRGPNAASALVVLFVANRACVAWPGDLPIGIACRALQARHIAPTFLVGPHHGAPQGWKARRMHDWVGGIGHEQLWVSVSWHRRFKHPRPEYLKAARRVSVVVRCSQLTPRCCSSYANDMTALLPTHEWLSLFRPRVLGPSCMGPMRVQFYEDHCRVCYEAEHAKAIKRLSKRCCK
jgi:beta-lactamase superfamily II metal-dependent hydrolase